MHTIPAWIEIVATISLCVGGICFIITVIDVRRNRQNMWIMDLVWPITMLYSSVLGLYFYFKVGKLSSRKNVMAAKAKGEIPPHKKKPHWQSIALAATHCGAGCTLGDLISEWLIVILPFAIFGRKIFAGWVMDYFFAFVIGIAFQYFTIKPMRGLSVKGGIIAALKADSLSLTSWQVGMYGWMAVATFAIFGFELPHVNPVFWFMMQIAMLFGFLTAYPTNWWLVRKKIKETI
jgi:hypothetical protein